MPSLAFFLACFICVFSQASVDRRAGAEFQPMISASSLPSLHMFVFCFLLRDLCTIGIANKFRMLNTKEVKKCPI